MPFASLASLAAAEPVACGLLFDVKMVPVRYDADAGDGHTDLELSFV